MFVLLFPGVLSSPSSPPEVCAVVSNHGSCDSVWASHAFTCSYLTSVDWDCSGCNCPGDRLQQHAAPPQPAASSSERRLTISLDAGEPVGSPAGSLPFAIFQSAARGELQEVAKWLRKGGSADAFSSVSTGDGQTAAFALLHAASCNGHLEIVTVLLKRGASVDLQSSFGYTALMAAADHGHLSVLRVLLQHSANPDLQSGGRVTALIVYTFTWPPPRCGTSSRNRRTHLFHRVHCTDGSGQRTHGALRTQLHARRETHGALGAHRLRKAVAVHVI